MDKKTMRGLMIYGKGDYRYETNIPIPQIGPDDILMKSEGSGVCASDVKCWHGASSYWGGDGIKPWVQAPFIPGHEFLGVVEEVGANITEYAPGDRITVEQIAPCGECRFCKNGQYWMCQPHQMFGYFTEFNGGMAEYVRIPTKRAKIHRVPKELPLDAALLIEPFSCSKHCVDRAQITPNDIVVISGAGTLGLGMITYASSLKPKTLIVLDMKDDRLAKAKEFGADIVWNPSKVDVVEEIMKMTEGYGCDIYIEATGHPSSVAQGMSMVRKLGRFVEFSVFGEPTTLDWSIIGDKKELDVLGSHLGPYCYTYEIEKMTTGEIKTNGVVTKKFDISEWETAFDYATGKYGDIKVAVVFDKE